MVHVDFENIQIGKLQAVEIGVAGLRTDNEF